MESHIVHQQNIGPVKMKAVEENQTVQHKERTLNSWQNVERKKKY